MCRNRARVIIFYASLMSEIQASLGLLRPANAVAHQWIPLNCCKLNCFCVNGNCGWLLCRLRSVGLLVLFVVAFGECRQVGFHEGDSSSKLTHQKPNCVEGRQKKGHLRGAIGS